MSRLLVRCTVWIRRRLRGSALAQTLAIVLLWSASDLVVRRFGWPVPGGVIGLATLLLLLSVGWLRSRTLSRAADWLLSEMLLFFVPAVLVITDMPQLLGLLGLKLMIAVMVGTTMVMLTTAIAIRFAQRWIVRDDD